MYLVLKTKEKNYANSAGVSLGQIMGNTLLLWTDSLKILQRTHV